MKPAILCIDDDQPVLNQLSAQLTRRFGATHVVECAESAEEALGLIEEISARGGEVHVVICDQVMPGMKGDRFLEAVHGRWPRVMKVLLTGQAGLEAAVYAINHAGLHRYVEKPWEAEDLGLAVQNLLDHYRLRADVELQQRGLERQARDLRSLHFVGAAVASAEEPVRVLEIVADAARSIGNVRAAGAVARPTPTSPCAWTGLGGLALSEADRAALEASLPGAPSSQDPVAPRLQGGCRAFPIPEGRRLLGWLLVACDDARSEALEDVLGILAEQAATRLVNLRLASERIESERLSTLGHMLSTIVHDFRNPMTAIKGYAGMIESFDLPRERLEECARHVLAECDRMTAMIEEILEFTRGVKSPLNLARIPVRELADRLRGLMEHDFHERGAAFTAELAYDGPVVVDVERMTRALANIASNALDAMGRGGVFTFASRLAGSSVELVLSDTGPGIPEALQSRVFEPFFSSGKPRGVGLGMSIARRIVEEHQGFLRLASTAPQGARFVVSLPLELSDALATRPQPVEPPRSTGPR